MIGMHGRGQVTFGRENPRSAVHDGSVSAPITVASPHTGTIIMPASADTTVTVATPFTQVRIIPASYTDTITMSATASAVVVMVGSVSSPVTVSATATGLMTFVASVSSSVYLSTLMAGGLTSLSFPGIDRSRDTWVTNLETGAPSQYDNFGFNSFATDGSDYWAATDDGLYLLDGDTDAGDAIPCLIITPAYDFGTHHPKRVNKAWIEADANGTLSLKAVYDDGTSNTYTSDNTSTDWASHRIFLGKGAKSDHWTFQVSCADKLEMDGMEVNVDVLSRR